MHTNHISTAWDAHEPFFSLAIEGRLTVYDLPGLEAFAEFEILKSSWRMNSINMLIAKGWVLYVEVACTLCLILYAERPWKSMPIYKTNSTVKTICNDLLLKLFWRAPNIKYVFVQRVWSTQRRWLPFLHESLLGESAGSMRKDIRQESRFGCLSLSGATWFVSSPCCLLDKRPTLPLAATRTAGF